MILVIGATGYIGRYLCPHLKEKGFDVLALGRSKKGEEFLKSHGVDFRYFDISKPDPFSALSDIDTSKVEAVINLSAKLPEFEVPVEDFFKINTIGVYETLEFARKNKIDKVIITSSHKVYNDVNDRDVISEDDGPEFRGPHSPYIISKIAAENFVRYYNKDYGMHAMVLRLTGVHGYGEIMGQLNNDGSYRKSAFEVFFGKALNGEDIEVWGKQLKRDHVYIKDVVQAIEKAILAKDASGIYNISSGVGRTQYEEAQVIAELLGSRGGGISKVTLNEEKPGLSRGYVYSIDKARKELGYDPKYVELKDMYIDYIKEWEKKEYHNFHEYSERDKPATA